VEAAFAEALKGVGDAVGERDRAAEALGLGVVELATHVGGDNPESSSAEVYIAPTQADQLALAQPGHLRGRLELAEGIGGEGVATSFSSFRGAAVARLPRRRWLKHRCFGRVVQAVGCAPALATRARGPPDVWCAVRRLTVLGGRA
jgi:hypothetical protein